MNESYDYIIVGGGSAGCVLANRLSADGKTSVCLLEAGPTHRSQLVSVPANLAITVPRKNARNWAFWTVPQPELNDRKGYQPRGRSLGGSSSINAMVYIRGTGHDYDRWADEGNTGWSFEDVLPFFKKAEHHVRGADDFHGVNGPLTVSPPRSPNPMNEMFLQAARECQIPINPDFNGVSQEGAGYYELTQRNGRRRSAAHAYLDSAVHRTNLTIKTDATVKRVCFNGNSAEGVDVQLGAEEIRLDAIREVVLSTGAFQSPQLLMLSGIGEEAALQEHGIACLHDLPGVGQNLQDHVDYTLLFETSSPHAIGINARSGLKVAIQAARFYLSGRGMLSTNFNETGAFLKTDPSEPAPDIQLHFAPALVDQHGRKRHSKRGVSCHVCVLRPQSRGSVTLRDRDYRSAPVIDPGFFTHPDDMKRLLKGIRMTQRLLAAPSLDEVMGQPMYASGSTDDAETIADIRSRADTIYHPVGTCRMGQDALSVVDERLRVRGVQKLRVIDASIMPYIVSGNTNAPAIMIGEKGAELIIEDAASPQLD
ncbi:MAG: glucose-methanol-choline oxidoreductase [Gammaproteobacteria bacterium]|nr:glucose-methanol-choline oxidoreductase [Gammaproteobacteria bacterium]RPG26426.1 MAG: glucose-methanol-choline oxidoreductase [Gammaproteobacteria bacterium TMED50]